jgi:hypothetical protein
VRRFAVASEFLAELLPVVGVELAVRVPPRVSIVLLRDAVATNAADSEGINGRSVSTVVRLALGGLLPGRCR